MTRIDYHLHTRESGDCSERMERMCRRAVEIGLDEICFTEHFDTDPYDAGFRYYDDARYERRLEAVRRQFAGRLAIRKGLELDFQSRHAARLAELIAPFRFDYLIGSAHCVFNSMPRRALVERGFPPDEIYRVYFDEVRALIATGLPHCLGHLDYFRKTCSDLLGPYYYAAYEEQMSDIVSRLVGAGMGLEVNSRHFDRGEPLMPSLDVLRMYREAGGDIVTVGSDAHRASEVGLGLAEACGALRQAGFTEYVAFEGGQPRRRPIPEGEGIVAPRNVPSQ